MDRRYMKIVKLCIVCIGAVGLYVVVGYSFIYVYPFIVAGCIAYMLHPVVTFLEKKWRFNRTVALFFILSLVFTAILCIAYLLLQRIILEATTLIHHIPIYANALMEMLENVTASILPYYNRFATWFPFMEESEQISESFIAELVEQMSNTAVSIFSDGIQIMTNIFSSFSYVAIVFIFILLFVFILTRDMHDVIHFYESITPHNIQNKIADIIFQLKTTTLRFIRAQLIITAITSLIVFISLMLFHVEHLFTMTLIVFIVDFIPYIGVGIIFIPWMLLTFFTGNYVLTIQLAVMYIFIIIIRQLIEPKILATSLRIHPLVALTILFIAIQSLGLIGFVLAPMFLISFSALYHARVFHYLYHFIKR